MEVGRHARLQPVDATANQEQQPCAVLHSSWCSTCKLPHTWPRDAKVKVTRWVVGWGQTQAVRGCGKGDSEACGTAARRCCLPSLHSSSAQ